MEMNQDVLRGKWTQMRGTVRQVRGQLVHSYREIVLGRFQQTAGVLQERRGVVIGRLERARRRLAARAGD